MTAYLMTPTMRVDLIVSLEATCGNRCNAEYNPCAERELLETLKAMKPVEPHSWYSAVQDESMTDKLRKDHERLGSYTHKHGKYDLPLYALGDTA